LALEGVREASQMGFPICNCAESLAYTFAFEELCGILKSDIAVMGIGTGSGKGV
jgi:hypothetical protein